jgi:hypothetical protein
VKWPKNQSKVDDKVKENMQKRVGKELTQIKDKFLWIDTKGKHFHHKMAKLMERFVD